MQHELVTKSPNLCMTLGQTMLFYHLLGTLLASCFVDTVATYVQVLMLAYESATSFNLSLTYCFNNRTRSHIFVFRFMAAWKTLSQSIRLKIICLPILTSFAAWIVS
jgi:hypothetical protein